MQKRVSEPEVSPRKDVRKWSCEGAEHKKTKLTAFLLFATSSAALNSVVMGYDIGVFGPAIEIIRSQMGLTNYQVGIAAGSMAFTGIFGAFAAGVVSDRFGRTKTLVSTSVLVFLGSVLMAAAPGYGCLLAGRLVTGFGVGMGLAVDPLFISEISPPHHRGALVSLSELGINIGILLGSLVSYVLGNVLQDEDAAWRLMLGLAATVPVAVAALACFFLPETPRWLMERGDRDAAVRVMRRLCRDEEEVQLTMADLTEALAREKAAGSASWRAAFSRPTPGARLAISVVLAVAAAQQACGVSIVTVLTPVILDEQAHLSPSASRAVYFGLTAWKTAAVAAAAPLVDRLVGRRPLMLASCAGCAISHLVIAGGFLGGSAPAVVAGLVLFVTSFSAGLGPVAWLITAEAMPTNLRAKGMVLGCSLNRAVAGLGLMFFLQAEGGDPHGGAGGFGVLALLSLLFLAVFAAVLPETKGRTLEEMAGCFEAYAQRQSRVLDAACCCWPAYAAPPPQGAEQAAGAGGGEGPVASDIRLELVRADGCAAVWAPQGCSGPTGAR